METKTVRSKPVPTRKMHELYQCLLPQTRYRLDNPRWWAQQNFLLQDNIHLLENGNKKLALSIRTKLDNIRINCHKTTIKPSTKNSTNNKSSTLPESGLPEGNNNFIKEIKFSHQKKCEAS